MLSLSAKKRIILGKKVKKLRRKDLIPGVIYGHKIPSENIEIERKSFEKVFREAGESTLVDLIVDEKPIKVLIHDIQYDPLKDKIIHVDFYRIKEKEKVSVEVNLKFTGEAPAVKEKGGTLVHHLTKIKIECLPKDLIHEIEVDLSNLKEFNDLIRIKDLIIPPEIKVLQGSDDVVVSISAPKAEEEVAPPPTAEAAVAPTEAVTEEKKEEATAATPKAEKKTKEKKEK